MSRTPNCICWAQGFGHCSRVGHINFKRTDPFNLWEINDWDDKHSIILCSNCEFRYTKVFEDTGSSRDEQLAEPGFMVFVTDALNAAEVHAMMRSPLSAPRSSAHVRARRPGYCAPSPKLALPPC